MKQIDLDDLPPKVAAQLAELAPGEELVLIKGGAPVAVLTGGPAPGLKPPSPEPEIVPDDRAREVFELFRSSVEDEF